MESDYRQKSGIIVDGSLAVVWMLMLLLMVELQKKCVKRKSMGWRLLHE